MSGPDKLCLEKWLFKRTGRLNEVKSKALITRVEVFKLRKEDVRNI